MKMTSRDQTVKLNFLAVLYAYGSLISNVIQKTPILLYFVSIQRPNFINKLVYQF